MSYRFDNATRIDEADQIVEDVLRQDGSMAIRVRVSVKHVEDIWQEKWGDKRAVRARFDVEKHKHQAAAANAGKPIYPIG